MRVGHGGDLEHPQGGALRGGFRRQLGEGVREGEHRGIGAAGGRPFPDFAPLDGIAHRAIHQRSPACAGQLGGRRDERGPEFRRRAGEAPQPGEFRQ